jgi:hypothetical protein
LLRDPSDGNELARKKEETRKNGVTRAVFQDLAGQDSLNACVRGALFILAACF